jgi:hypothetical protein
VTLLQKQQKFSRLVAKLIQQANEMGYEVTLAEAHRPDFTAQKYKALGIGTENSLHRLRLAIDINLFLDGKYLTRTEDHRPLGEWWEKQSTEEYECAWGGRFGDGNHYSISNSGVR